jgi:hypothetical protein
MNTLYDTAFHAWAFDQARRVTASEPIGTENVAEELATLGRNWEQELVNRLTCP